MASSYWLYTLYTKSSKRVSAAVPTATYSDCFA